MTDRTNGDDCAYPIERMLSDVGSLGLTKREYFAAMAMQGALANAQVIRLDSLDGSLRAETTYAAQAVKQADALIEALNRMEAANV